MDSENNNNGSNSDSNEQSHVQLASSSSPSLEVAATSVSNSLFSEYKIGSSVQSVELAINSQHKYDRTILMNQIRSLFVNNQIQSLSFVRSVQFLVH